MAVDSEKIAFTYNGTSWSSPVVIDSSFSTVINGVSCASSTFCVAVDSAAEAITYNGSTWSAPSVIGTGEFLTSVSCPSAGFCAAVDDTGDIFGYNGTTWTGPVSIDGTNRLTSISCLQHVLRKRGQRRQCRPDTGRSGWHRTGYRCH